MPTSFTQNLLLWFQQSGRKNLPWQTGQAGQTSPQQAYGIWVSEIMLQQTQVSTVISYYGRFMHRFPSIEDLANAKEDEVLHLWSGLGYYARARNLHRAAQHIQNKHKGSFPNTFDEVLALPGIGRSTAGAILAFAFGQHRTILDGNVKRVLCRFHGVEGYSGQKAIENQLWSLAKQHTPKLGVAKYTQAIMDLGATCCTRSQPQCLLCPQNKVCFAYRNDRTNELPHRKPKAASRPKKSVVMLIVANTNNHICLIKRPSKGIWGGLYVFPEFETEIQLHHWVKRYIPNNTAEITTKSSLKHRFTHFDLSIQPLYLKLTAKQTCNIKNIVWFDLNQPSQLGLPSPVQKILSTL